MIGVRQYLHEFESALLTLEIVGGKDKSHKDHLESVRELLIITHIFIWQ